MTKESKNKIKNTEGGKGRNMEDVVGNCPSCEKYTTFKYEGIQNDMYGCPAFPLYTCRVCESTHSLRRII